MSLNFKQTRESTETTGFSPQFLTYGINLLKINHIELKESSTEKYQVKFWVEGPALKGDFTGADLPDGTKAKGLVGKANLGVYFDPKDDSKMETLINNLMFIAEKAGVADQVALIEADTLQDLLNQYLKIITGHYMWFVLKGEEYESGRYIFSLKEGRIGMDENGNKIYQVYCKSAEFSDGDSDDVVDGRTYKLKGINVVGNAIGKTDSLEFNPTYDLKLLKKEDKSEKADVEKDLTEEIKDRF